MKFCTRCNLERTYSNFHKNSSSPDGLRNYCKVCSKEYNKAHNLKAKAPDYVKKTRIVYKGTLTVEEANYNYFKDLMEENSALL